MRLLLPSGDLLGAARALLARARIECEAEECDPFDVPRRVAAGETPAGLCGLDHVLEADLEPIESLLDLGLDPADLVVASLRETASPATIATAYPRVAKRWAETHRLPELRAVAAGAAADLFLGRTAPGKPPDGGVLRERILRATTWLIARRNAVRAEGPAGPLHAWVARFKRAGIRRAVFGAQHPSAFADPAAEGWDRWGRPEGW